MFKRIDHVEIIARDAQKTIDFYTTILGFNLKSRHRVDMPPMQEVSYLQLGDSVVEIIAVDDPEARSEIPWQIGYRCLALEVDDMVQAVGYLRGRGIAISREPVELDDSYRCEIRDPDGLMIELRQWK